MSRTVLFDVYATRPTKSQEQRRQYTLRRWADINLTWNISIPVKQKYFLSNTTNKSQFISLLRTKLDENGIQILRATDAADVLIVKTTVELSSHSSEAVIGEDVDYAVLLRGSTPPTQDILLLKPGRENIKTKYLAAWI